MEKIQVTIDYAEKNYSAGTGEVNGIVLVTGKSIDDVKKEFKSAFAFHVEGSLADGDELPQWLVEGNYEFDYQLSISALLQHYGSIITRSALSRVTGINERQLGHYATGHRKPRPAQRDKIIQGFHRLGKEFSAV